MGTKIQGWHLVNTENKEEYKIKGKSETKSHKLWKMNISHMHLYIHAFLLACFKKNISSHVFKSRVMLVVICRDLYFLALGRFNDFSFCAF